DFFHRNRLHFSSFISRYPPLDLFGPGSVDLCLFFWTDRGQQSIRQSDAFVGGEPSGGFEDFVDGGHLSSSKKMSPAQASRAQSLVAIWITSCRPSALPFLPGRRCS